MLEGKGGCSRSLYVAFDTSPYIDRCTSIYFWYIRKAVRKLTLAAISSAYEYVAVPSVLSGYTYEYSYIGVAFPIVRYLVRYQYLIPGRAYWHLVSYIP